MNLHEVNEKYFSPTQANIWEALRNHSNPNSTPLADTLFSDTPTTELAYKLESAILRGVALSSRPAVKPESCPSCTTSSASMSTEKCFSNGKTSDITGLTGGFLSMDFSLICGKNSRRNMTEQLLNLTANGPFNELIFSMCYLSNKYNGLLWMLQKQGFSSLCRSPLSSFTGVHVLKIECTALRQKLYEIFYISVPDMSLKIIHPCIKRCNMRLLCKLHLSLGKCKECKPVCRKKGS